MKAVSVRLAGQDIRLTVSCPSSTGLGAWGISEADRALVQEHKEALLEELAARDEEIRPVCKKYDRLLAQQHRAERALESGGKDTDMKQCQEQLSKLTQEIVECVSQMIDHGYYPLGEQLTDGFNLEG